MDKHEVTFVRCLKCRKILQCSRYDTAALLEHIQTDHPEVEIMNSDSIDKISKNMKSKPSKIGKQEKPKNNSSSERTAPDKDLISSSEDRNKKSTPNISRFCCITARKNSGAENARKNPGGYAEVKQNDRPPSHNFKLDKRESRQSIDSNEKTSLLPQSTDYSEKTPLLCECDNGTKYRFGSQTLKSGEGKMPEHLIKKDINFSFPRGFKECLCDSHFEGKSASNKDDDSSQASPGADILYTKRYKIKKSSPTPSVKTISSNQTQFQCSLYRTTIEKWRPGNATIYCPQCGCNKSPFIKSRQEQFTQNQCFACCLFSCWPFCLLPCLISDNEIEYLYCSKCRALLGVYNHSLNCTQPYGMYNTHDIGNQKIPEIEIKSPIKAYKPARVNTPTMVCEPPPYEYQRTRAYTTSTPSEVYEYQRTRAYTTSTPSEVYTTLNGQTPRNAYTPPRKAYRPQPEYTDNSSGMTSRRTRKSNLPSIVIDGKELHPDMVERLQSFQRYGQLVGINMDAVGGSSSAQDSSSSRYGDSYSNRYR